MIKNLLRYIANKFTYLLLLTRELGYTQQSMPRCKKNIMHCSIVRNNKQLEINFKRLQDGNCGI